MILVFLLTESCEIKYTINKWIWRNNMFKKGKRLAALCTIIFVVLSMCMPCLADETQKTIRVGSFEDTFNYVDEHGVRRGYGYELMQALAGYTGWKFEYVKCDWSNCFDKLENGEIDIMGDIAYTDDRAKEMLYSEETMGEEKYVLYANLSDVDIVSSDFKSLDGKRIGVLKGTNSEYMLTNWENKYGIHTEHVNVSGNEDVKKKLANNEIDCFVSLEESIWSERGISSVTTIGKSDIYFVFNKERSDIKQELDYAMRQLDSDSPFFKADLYKKYFTLDYTQFLTGVEKSYIKEHGGIRIGFLDNDSVVFSMDKKSGEIRGTFSEYISYAKDCLGNHTLKFDIEAFDDYSEEELFMIFGLLCEQNDFRMDLEAQDTLKSYLNELCNHKPDNFANGREMRNLFDKSKKAHSNRLASLNEISDEDLITFKKDDLLRAIEEMKLV